jgi:hypothetical protein
MLSRSTLEAELIAFRNSLKPPQPDKRGRLIGNRNSADQNLLNRWIAKADQNLWQTFFANVGAVPATDIIQLVLKARRSAQASVNREYGAHWIDSSGEKHRVPGFNEQWIYVLSSIRKQPRSLTRRL